MKHILESGRTVIDSLVQLGTALEYRVDRELRVGTRAAVDLAWSLDQGNSSPLFIFEVESTASAGMASNPMKVFGQDSKVLARPLFFFHIVLAGSADNERVLNAQRQWGVHNYRVYRFEDARERAALVTDVLNQHQRVAPELRLLPLAFALEHPALRGTDAVPTILQAAEDQGFSARYSTGYAVLALRDVSYAPLFARRIRGGGAGRDLDDGIYGGGADLVPGLLETATAISIDDPEDLRGPEDLERWSSGASTGLRMIDAAFGLSRDYDEFILGQAPIHYALAFAALRDHPRSRRWILDDFTSLLVRERHAGLARWLEYPGEVWLAYLLAAELGMSASDDRDLLAVYSELQAHIAACGGVPVSLLAAPPRPFSLDDRDQLDWIDDELVTLPHWTVLRDAVLQRAAPGGGTAITLRARATISALVDFGAIFDSERIVQAMFTRQ